MDVKINRSDIIWSYLGVIVSFTASVITLPVVIYFLDGELLGLWYVFGSVGGITILFDFGFTVTFARNITYCWSGARKLEKTGTSGVVELEPDFEMMRDVLYTCKRVYLIISLTAYLLLLTIGTGYIIHISSTIPGYTHIIAWIIFSTGAFLNLYYNYYDSFLRGVGAIKQANQNRVYARLIQLITMIVLLLAGCGILGLSIANFLFGIVFRFLGKNSFFKYKGIGEQLAKVKTPIDNGKIKQYFTTIWYNAWRDGVVALSVYLFGQASVILCSLYLSLTETGMYSIGLQIANVVQALSTTLYVTYQPSLQSNWVKGNKTGVKRLMLRIIKVFIASYLVCVVGVIFIGIPLLKLIKPDVIISIPLMLGIFVSYFILGYRDSFTSYFSCTNRLIYVPAFIISSVACVLLSIVLMQWGGMNVWGLVVAQIASQLVFNAWYWSVKAHRELNIGLKDIIQVKI